MFINSTTGAHEMMFNPSNDEKKVNCCQGDGLLYCLKEPELFQYQHVEIQNIHNNYSINNNQINSMFPNESNKK